MSCSSCGSDTCCCADTARGRRGRTGPTGPTGPASAVSDVAVLEGLIGPQGVAGLAGAIGPQGLAGLVGAIGPIGVAGLVGAVGPQGVAGLVGEQKVPGLAGIVGEQGVAGVVGLTGPQGPAGPPGPIAISEYAYIYNLTSRTVPIEADVLFDANGPITPGIAHTPGSDTVILVNAGTYEVTFSVSGTEPNQFALVLNGIPLPETVYGSGAGTQQNTGQAIFVAPAGATLELRNHSSAAAVTLQPLAGGTQPNVNASLVIVRLA